MNMSFEGRSLDMDKVPSACPYPRPTATAAALSVLIAQQNQLMASKCPYINQNAAHMRAKDALAKDYSLKNKMHIR
jgi:hypothetical protein